VSSRGNASTDRLLVVIDDQTRAAVVTAACQAAGYDVEQVSTEAEAAAAMADRRPSVVVTDLRLPFGSGAGVVRAAKTLDAGLPVITQAASDDAGAAVEAMKEGALDCLVLPVDASDLVRLVGRALDGRRALATALLSSDTSMLPDGVPRIVGQDPALLQVLAGLERAAATGATVLLEGESGTGKELFARTLHGLSPRAGGPFVAINCAAIPETLLESELFGHEKGAFTGAVARKPGKFEVADGGTLFLDEIGDLPQALQAKILRVVETRSFERIGGTTPLQVDVRLVAASNRDLRARVAAHEFREDLFFRLSVFPIRIPPLRDRKADIPVLARVFIERFSKELDRAPLPLSLAAEDRLLQHGWPGNVRELQNCLERAVILCDADALGAQHLDLSSDAVARPPADPWDAIDLSGSFADASRRVLAEVERRKIESALRQTGANTGQAADLLRISHRTLMVKMSEHGITVARLPGAASV